MAQPPLQLLDLVERFDRNREAYRSPHYNETQVRREFLDPLFKCLGWDIDNEQGYGIKTGLNEAFIIDAPTRRALIQKDRRSAELIKPLLGGEDIRRYTTTRPDYGSSSLAGVWTSTNTPPSATTWQDGRRT